MAYKTVLAHCNDKRRIKRLAGAAVEVADRFGAHLIGLSISPPVLVVPAGMPGTPDTMVIDERCQAYRRDNAELRSAFFEAGAHGQKVVPEWRELDAASSSVSAVVLAHARAADLVVASQRDATWSGSAHLAIGDALIMGCGRPVLIVPNEGLCSGIGRRVLVAWNGSREAARAVFDAVPFLQGAEDVKVIRIDSSEEADDSRQPATDICTALARHGVRCQATEMVRTHADVGHTLTQHTISHRADLLVMGCYGHSRLRELVFGGVSRHQLRQMAIPVLMSH